MSKVHADSFFMQECDHLFTPHHKRKLKRAKRRKDSFLVKNKRMDACGKNHYGPFGYYIKSERKHFEYGEDELVERRPAAVYATYEKNIPYLDQKGNEKTITGTYKKIIGYHIYPPKKVRNIIKVRYVPCVPYIQRYSRNNYRKCYKRYASKRLRRLNVEEDIGSGSCYKKNFDLIWQVY